MEELAHHASQINRGLLIYEDMLHLVKCDRYRKASGPLICPTLYESKPTISAESFEKNGISKWIIYNCRYTKMDDTLPLKFFTYENICHFRKLGRFDLAFSLLPSTLLIEAVMNENYNNIYLYNKKQRLNL